MCEEKFCNGNVATVMFDNGTASGHLDKRSIRIKQYLNPREGESDPMMSKWTWSKRTSGIESFSEVVSRDF